MQRLFLVILILALGVTAADARRRKHRYHVYQPYMYVVPREAAAVPRAGQSFEVRRRPERTTVPPFDEPRPLRYRNAADLVPSDWQLQPADPNLKGQRFLSPDGTGSFTAYTVPADQNSIAAHLKKLAFGDGEEITHIRGERTWIAVSGFKGDRIFYRKAVLACAGERWHNVAFEYPASAKRTMAEFVNRASEVAQLSQNHDCDTPVSNR
jgi:hypothetical protein